MLKFVLRRRSCHSASVAVYWVCVSALARHCDIGAAAGHQEGRLQSLDDRFGRDRIAQERLTLLESGDELLPVLNLCCINSHGCQLQK
jgi:hypothetical protein